jgi:tRNA(Ile2) C34 agmatinyltransferase TiaS
MNPQGRDRGSAVKCETHSLQMKVETERNLEPGSMNTPCARRHLAKPLAKKSAGI